MKVSLFVWHLFRNRLPTKDNLFRQGVIPYDAQLCVTCCGNIKLANHLFLGCNVFNSVWHLLQNWLGISSVDPFGISDHFFQFSYSTSVSKARRSMMNFVWLSCAWVIWNERNSKIFKNKTTCSHHLLVKIRLLSCLWLKAKYADFVFNYHNWWLSPFVCLVLIKLPFVFLPVAIMMEIVV